MKIFAFSGALRAGSLNRKLIVLAAEAARRAGAEVDLGDFRDYCPPNYDGDAEAASGLPKEAEALIAKIEWANGIIVSTPEYNRSVPGPLKNAFDWISRLKPYRLAGKNMLLIGATSGKTGCVNGILALRNTLEFQTAKVYADSFGMSGAATGFTPEGQFADAAQAQKLAALLKAFVAQA